MLSKKSYRQVVKGLERIRQHHIEDRKENPHLAPCGYTSSIVAMIRRVVSDNHERLADQTCKSDLEYLAKQGLIVPYLGSDYTFPSDVPLPSREEVIKQTEAAINDIFGRD